MRLAVTQTVAVVDDDPDVIEFLEMFLSMQGVDVVAFDHAGDVIEAIRDIKPDVVLLDLQTPDDRQAGLRILAQIRADDVLARVPVILMSADHAALVRHATRLHELDALPLMEPFDPDHLYQMMEQLAA